MKYMPLIRVDEAAVLARPRGLGSPRLSIQGIPVRRLADRTETRPRDVISVMPYSMDLLYQAERRPAEAERRRADLARGLMAARTARRWRRVTGAVRALRPGRPGPSRVACGAR
jgi:hypothetical protein